MNVLNLTSYVTLLKWRHLHKEDQCQVFLSGGNVSPIVNSSTPFWVWRTSKYRPSLNYLEESLDQLQRAHLGPVVGWMHTFFLVILLKLCLGQHQSALFPPSRKLFHPPSDCDKYKCVLLSTQTLQKVSSVDSRETIHQYKAVSYPKLCI